MYNSYEDLKGYKWAKEVVEGKFIANKYVILECQRYIDRLEKLQHEEDFGYFFNLEEAEIVFGLTKLMNFPTGFFAGKPIYDHIAGFQAFVIENIFCWDSKEADENGLVTKMIEEVYLEIGRKSSKSFLTGLIEVLILLRAAKFSQSGIGGKTRDISALVKTSVIELIKSSPLIAKYFKITRDKITCLINEATLKNFSGEADNINGLLLTSFIVDECSNMETNDVIGALKLSQMSVNGSRLSIYISTQYDNTKSVFNELIDYHKKVLLGVVDNAPTNTLGLLFELDEEDDYMDSKNWIKASPLQMTFENGRKFLKSEFAKALEVPSQMREFRIKILNQRLTDDGTESFVPISDLKKGCLEEEYDFRGKDVYIGIDLSLTTDTTSISFVHYDEIKNEFYSKIFCFVPQDTIFQRSKIEKIDYQMMCANKYCYACGDRIIDYSFVEDFLIRKVDEMGVNVLGIGYDKFNAMSSVNKWTNYGFETIEVRQHSTVLSAGTKLFKESVLQNRFFYDKNRLFEYQMSNARTAYDTNLNQYINKKKSTGRIDMAVATMIAFVMWNTVIVEGSNVYDSEERDGFICI